MADKIIELKNHNFFLNDEKNFIQIGIESQELEGFLHLNYDEAMILANGIISMCDGKSTPETSNCNLSDVRQQSELLNCPDCKRKTKITNNAKTMAKCFYCGTTWAI